MRLFSYTVIHLQFIYNVIKRVLLNKNSFMTSKCNAYKAHILGYYYRLILNEAKENIPTIMIKIGKPIEEMLSIKVFTTILYQYFNTKLYFESTIILHIENVYGLIISFRKSFYYCICSI